jgi:hypothetical protein
MLLYVLQYAEKPLTLGELSLRMQRPYRAVAVALAAACHAGTVIRLEGGLYTISLGPPLAELLACVNACEVQWKRDVHFGVIPRARAGDDR